MKKLFLTALAVAWLVVLFVSCKENATSETIENPDTSSMESEASEMISFNPSDYVIVYPNDGFKEKYLALLVSNAIEKETDVTVPYKADASVSESEYEILIGNTNRSESSEILGRNGDSSIVIAAVNKKIVIYASKDTYYEAALHYLIDSLTKNAELSFSADLCVIVNTISETASLSEFPKNSGISFETVFSHENSAVELRIGSYEKSKFCGYAVEFAVGSVALYSQDGKRVELAKKVVISEVGKKYNILCFYDGEYLRAYLSDPESELEPWAAFEIKASELSGEVFIGETTGYGAEISAIEQKEISFAVSGETYRNNVILNAADPDIIYHEGYYYMYVTGDRYPVYRSSDLANWHYIGDALPEVSWNIDKRYMWAPDVEYIGGKFYMAVTIGEAGFGIAVAERPEGPFVCAGNMPFLTKTIDGHIFVDDDGRIYLYYTSWCDGRAYGIWGVEMESDCLTPKWETEKLIFTPTEPWESSMNMGGIVEAPFMLKKDGIYYLVYSGSNYQADYAVGYATSDKPLEGFVKSANNPILRGTADTRGTGHCSIIETAEGGMVMVYHVHNTPTQVQPRHVAIDPVRFVKTEDGYRLEVCGPTTSKIPIDIFK